MSLARSDADVPFLGQPLRAGAVICRTERGNLHAGVIYRDGNEAAILHLGWDDVLSRDWSWARFWATPDIEPERLLSIAGLCRRIWEIFEAERVFPYALRFAGTTFDLNGRLRLSEGAQGLTCATLILAVFRAFRIELVHESDWPIRQDEDRAFLAFVERFAEPQHFQILREEVEAGCVRIQPDEVVGACACELPASFEPSRAAADELVLRLNVQ